MPHITTKLVVAAFGMSMIGFGPGAARDVEIAEQPKLKISPGVAPQLYVFLKCTVEDDWPEGGGLKYKIVRLFNTSNSTLPKGTQINWRLSTGHSGWWKLYPTPWPPSAPSTAYDVPQAARYVEGLSCTAKAGVPRRAIIKRQPRMRRRIPKPR